jgi:hypothetical protein
MKKYIVYGDYNGTIIGEFYDFLASIVFCTIEARKRDKSSGSYCHINRRNDGEIDVDAGACPQDEDGAYWPRIEVISE